MLPMVYNYMTAPGSLTIDIAVTPSITGLSTTAAIGVIDPTDQVVGLTSHTITSTQGTAVAPNEDVSITGISITATLGTPIAVMLLNISSTYGISNYIISRISGCTK